MLSQMRENFTGKFALALLVMIGLSFVFFGLNYSFVGSTYVAKVNGDKIDALRFEQDYRNALLRNPQLAEYTGPLRVEVRRLLLDQLIAGELLDDYLAENGYRVGDDQIVRNVQTNPAFQVDGRFDEETYRMLLAQNLTDAVEYELGLRNALRQQQLESSVVASAIVTPAEYRRYLNLVRQQRVVTVASISQADVADELVVTDDMVEAYYNDNPAMFQQPESADIEYIRISRNDVAESIEVGEAELLEWYEQNKDRFRQDEQRRARHILILSGDDEAAAEARAAEALARVQAGEAFETVAAEMSDDTGTAAQGGDFGVRTESQLPVDLAGEIFDMQEGDVAGPLKSEFGFHVVKLDEILEPGPLPLEQVRGEGLSELREQQSDDRFRELERALSDALFDNADLQTISDTVGIEVQTASEFTRNGGEPFGSNQAAIDAVFDDLVLTGGQISEVTELDADSSAIFRVTQYNQASRKPLADVRGEIENALRAQQAEEILAMRAEQVLEAVAAGEEFGPAAEAAGLTVSEPQLWTRGDQAVDQALMFDVFAAAKPTGDEPVTGRVRTMDGSYAVYSLEAVLPGRPESIPLAERDQGKLVIGQQSGVGDYTALVRSLYNDADIVINEDVLAADDLFQ